MSKKSSNFSSPLSVQNIILAATAWGIIALLVFLLGSPIVPRPGWYSVVTYIIENVAMLGAAMLCFRNWNSSQIVSGRFVWLLLGLGMASYFIGNLLLGWWELVWQLSPNVSPADLFYLMTYLFLGTGMLMAVVSRQLNLTSTQWMIVAGIAIAAIILAYFVSYAGSEEEGQYPDPVAPIAEPVGNWQTGAIALSGTPQFFAQESPLPQESPVSGEADVESSSTSNAPGWVNALNNQLEPYADIVALLYVVGDIFLVIMATMLLLAFWGGRFSISWRFIAAAAFCFYIADTWFSYAIERFENYATGALPEVFWVFSGVLFSIGAALEYSLSMRSRRGIRRRS
ncbi:MAG: hypothetical protein ACFE0I_18180 [Elainellaceae cyanobacterium]